MSKKRKEELLVFEANMDAGLRRHFRRTGAEMVSTEMPFDRMLSAEDDGIARADEEEAAISEYDMRQRVIGVRAFLRFLKVTRVSRDGVHVFDMESIMQQLFAAGRAVHDEFFGSLTMGESAQMFSHTRAAHSWRCKLISGQIKLAGMHGEQLPGQKKPELSATYAAMAKGNQHRKKKTGKPVQKSFLRKLSVKKNPKED